MKFTAAVVLAAAAGASASYNGTAVTTKVVDVYTTYCPYATQITHGSKTYTVTEATTLTITDCPCTVTVPVTTATTTSCSSTGVVYYNSTVPAVVPPTTAVASTGGVVPTSPPIHAGAGKAAALSGAGLAGIVGLAAFVL